MSHAPAPQSANVSLAVNPVFVYQVAKLLGGPLIALLEVLIFKSRIGTAQGCSIATLLLGMGLVMQPSGGTAYGDRGGASVAGLACAAVAVVSSAAQTLACRWLQRRRGISSGDLLLLTALPQAISLGLAGPLLDRMLMGSWVFRYRFTAQSLS